MNDSSIKLTVNFNITLTITIGLKKISSELHRESFHQMVVLNTKIQVNALAARQHLQQFDKLGWRRRVGEGAPVACQPICRYRPRPRGT